MVARRRKRGRNRLEDVIKELPEHEPIYRDEIEVSRKREEDMVAANDKTAAAKTAEVEAAQKAEETQKSEPAVQLVEPPPPPANDNRATAFANLAAQGPESLADQLPDGAQVFNAAQMGFAAAGIAAQIANPLSLGRQGNRFERHTAIDAGTAATTASATATR